MKIIKVFLGVCLVIVAITCSLLLIGYYYVVIAPVPKYDKEVCIAGNVWINDAMSLLPVVQDVENIKKQYPDIQCGRDINISDNKNCNGNIIHIVCK